MVCRMRQKPPQLQELVSVLLSVGADPNYSSVVRSVGTITYTVFADLAVLLRQAASPPLLSAVQYGDAALVKLLLDRGARPNILNEVHWIG
jgi:ankyrin repeat protein